MVYVVALVVSYLCAWGFGYLMGRLDSEFAHTIKAIDASLDNIERLTLTATCEIKAQQEPSSANSPDTALKAGGTP